MQEFIIAMENETGEMYFYYFSVFYGILLCRNHTSWIKLIFAFMHALCVDNTGQFIHGSFIVFSSSRYWHMQEFIIAMENETGEMYFYYF